MDIAKLINSKRNARTTFSKKYFVTSVPPPTKLIRAGDLDLTIIFLLNKFISFLSINLVTLFCLSKTGINSNF